MNRIALRSAIRTTLGMLAVALGSAAALTAAIWLPTLAFQHLAGWPLFEAYMMGAPIGIMIVCFGYIAVIAYRRKARQLRRDAV
jgi:uncharacterized transporter YbjL